MNRPSRLRVLVSILVAAGLVGLTLALSVWGPTWSAWRSSEWLHGNVGAAHGRLWYSSDYTPLSALGRLRTVARASMWSLRPSDRLWPPVVVQYRFVAVSCWVPVLTVSVMYLAISLRHGSHGEESCARCGYDLTGNVSGRCPECGRTLDPNSDRALTAGASASLGATPAMRLGAPPLPYGRGSDHACRDFTEAPHQSDS